MLALVWLAHATCIDNCLTCDYVDEVLTCVECEERYYLNATCVPCTDHCVVCANGTYCVECDAGYSPLVDAQNVTRCAACPAGCVACDNETCLECGKGYAMTSDDRCKGAAHGLTRSGRGP